MCNCNKSGGSRNISTVGTARRTFSTPRTPSIVNASTRLTPTEQKVATGKAAPTNASAGMDQNRRALERKRRDAIIARLGRL